MKNSIITLLTDFGTKDHYVASMKGVILNINARCDLIDITHEVTPHDVQEGAFVLANAFSFFPKATIHMAVVDPEVGGPRKSILLKTKNYIFLGPDNGLFTLVAKQEKVQKVIHLTNPKYFLPNITPTFHGRDIFAPIAAHLSLGVNPKAFGEELDHWQKLEIRKPEVKGQKLLGEIIFIDRFGNLISNIDGETFFRFIQENAFTLRIKRATLHGLKKGYWEGKRDEVIGLIGSGGFLEISINKGNAQKVLRVKKGDKIEIRKERS